MPGAADQVATFVSLPYLGVALETLRLPLDPFFLALKAPRAIDAICLTLDALLAFRTLDLTLNALLPALGSLRSLQTLLLALDLPWALGAFNLALDALLALETPWALGAFNLALNALLLTLGSLRAFDTLLTLDSLRALGSLSLSLEALLLSLDSLRPLGLPFSALGLRTFLAFLALRPLGALVAILPGLAALGLVSPAFFLRCGRGRNSEDGNAGDQ